MLLLPTLAAAAHAQDTSQLSALKWRAIGPFRGGRVSATSGAIGRPGTFYIGLPKGGIWKTTSNGVTWFPVSDSIRTVNTFGSVQVAPSNPDVVYAGTGEAIGGWGDGVYKTEDGGKTWQHLPGLEESKQIPCILVDPHNADVALLASLGDDRIKTKQRGVFRTTDGGKTWVNTLLIDDQTGIMHMAWAFNNPGVIYAVSSKHFGRGLSIGGGSNPANTPAESIYKSTDEGVTWKKLETKGLPKLFGRTCLAVANTADPNRVFIIGQFGLYRSDDGGANWRQMAKDDDRIQNGQGDYNCGVYVNPTNPDTVYALSTCSFISTDGGNTFTALKGAPGGDDYHEMWFDPTDGNRILVGCDQGGTVSVDGGKTWGPWYNQQTGQLYHISVDNQFPYNIYGTQQDSGNVILASRGNLGAITMLDWKPQAGFETGSTVADPLNPNTVWALGFRLALMKISYPSGQYMEVGPDLNPNETLVSDQSAPMDFSPSNPHELMVGYNYLLSTTDGGAHWRRLSPDLTKQKRVRRAPGLFGRFGPAISSFSECTASSGTIWAGTNTGIIQVTTDRGATWTDVTIPKLGKGDGVACIEASHRNPAEAYAAVATFSSSADPKIYRTKDYGKTWTLIVEGLPKNSPVSGPALVVRADTKKDGLLFTGTDGGFYVSFDDGDHWQSLLLNMPTCQFTDLQVHDNDLIVSTFGRGVWILDDFSCLREVTPGTQAETAHLYKPGGGYRLRRNVNLDTPFPPEVPHAENPPLGAVIYYSFATKPTDVKIEIADSSGRVVRHYSNAPVAPYDDPPTSIADLWRAPRLPIPTEIGLNRINWDVRYDIPPAFVHDPQDTINANPGETPNETEGPLALPGDYTVRLIVDGKTYTQPVRITNDPRSPANFAAIRSEQELLMGCYDGARTAYDGYQQIAALRAQIAPIMAAKQADVAKAAKDYDDKLAAVEGTVSHGRPIFGPPEPISFTNAVPYLLYQLAAWDDGDIAPTDSMRFEYGYDWAALHKLCDQWRSLAGKGLGDFNGVLSKNGLPTLTAETPVQEPPSPTERFLPKPAPVAPIAKSN
ncbi:MAG TPA: YCF48-related protein [Fimbriimonadaceae bacterium]